MVDELWCGSRAHSASYPGPDKWRVEAKGDRTCSFCGSLHPDDFLRLVEQAADQATEVRIEKADGKDHKWYVRQPNVANASEGGIKFYTWHNPGGDWHVKVNAIIGAAVHASQVKFEIFMQDVQESFHQDRKSK